MITLRRGVALPKYVVDCSFGVLVVPNNNSRVYVIVFHFHFLEDDNSHLLGSNKK